MWNEASNSNRSYIGAVPPTRRVDAGDQGTSGPASRPLTMKDRSWESRAYIKYIESCYRNYPEAFAYYEPLKEHLEAGSGRQQSSLQPVNLYEIAPSSALDDDYPRLFPFQSIQWLELQQRPRVVVLEGFPSPESVGLLGARLQIRPEFFIGNLTLTRNRAPTRHSYDLPTIPSLQANLIRVRFASTMRDLKDPIRETSNQIAQQRSDLEKAFSRYDQGLTSDRQYGHTRFRRVHLHDSRTYSTEQSLSMTVSKHGDQWTVIFLTDQGRSLKTSQGLPWTYNQSTNRPVGTIDLVPYNLPVSPNKSSAAAHSLASSASGVPRSDQSPGASLDQFHPLRRVALNDHIDAELLKTDPFFLLASVLTTSLLSWSQLLNMVNETVSRFQDQLELTYEELELDLNQLRYHIQVIYRAKEHLSESLKLVERGGSPDWPRASNLDAIERKEAIKERLRMDYLHIMDRYSLLARQCESTTTVLVGFAQLRTAEKGSDQAREVHSLTRLATVFIPLTFAATLFGMNIEELDPEVSIGWFFLFACGFSIVTFLVVFRRKLRAGFSSISMSRRGRSYM